MRVPRRGLVLLCAFGAAVALGACSGAVSEKHGAAPAVKAAKSAAVEPANEGTPARMRLITSDQYLNTVAYVFGDDMRMDTNFAPLRRTDGLLENGAATMGVPAAQIEQYQRAAATIAAKVVNADHRDFLIPCKPVDEKAADAACATKFLAATGRLLYRRPMDADMIKEAVDKAAEGAARMKDFYAGLALAVEGMLISPDALFIADISEPDPKRPGKERLDAYSLASRLSFFLWNAAPDDAVLKAAETGEILTPKGRAKVVDMMLASPRLVAGMRTFFDDMFGFDDFANLAKDPKVYPSFTGVAVQDAREQTLRTVISHLLDKQGDYRDLYTTRSTFISPALAALYHLPATPNWIPYEFPADSPRVGLLTQISFLAVHSHPGRSSPTLRGKALRERILCQVVPRPPANVDFSAVENPTSPIKTQRERVSIHLKNPVCAGCHKITDPMGLALENFDGSGAYRETEKGEAIDASGSLDGAAFKTVVGLGQALHDHPQLSACLTRRLYSYGLGGPTTSDDQAVMTYLTGKFAGEGYKLPALLRAIATSNAFATVRKVEPAAKSVALESPASLSINATQ